MVSQHQGYTLIVELGYALKSCAQNMCMCIFEGGDQGSPAGKGEFYIKVQKL